MLQHTFCFILRNLYPKPRRTPKRKKMLLQGLPYFALMTVAYTLSVPLQPLILQLASENVTLLSLATNSTNETNEWGKWPQVPFTKYLEEDTDIQVLSCTPSSPTDPISQRGTLDSISIISQRVRTQGTRLAMMQEYHDQSIPVVFRFRSKGDAFFRGSEIASILDLLRELTNLYGTAAVSGRLVRAQIDVIAYFDLALKSA